jgi:hypothetical protein
MDPKFKSLSIQLTGELNMLWVLMNRAQRAALTSGERILFDRTLSKVNDLHRELFPGIEGGLYDDALLNWLDGES